MYFQPHEPLLKLIRFYYSGKDSHMSPRQFRGTEGLSQDFEFVIDCVSIEIESPRKQ